MSNDSAKQKAVEIVEKYLKCTFKDYEGTTETFDMAEAKQCAMIAVDVVLEALRHADDFGDYYRFYEQVRSEIEKL